MKRYGSASESGDRYQFAGDDGRAGGNNSQVFGVHGDVILSIIRAVVMNKNLGIVIVL